jgi:hypothetical protein
MEPQYILDQLNVTEEVLNIYPYGSRVYGTNSEQSDYDYIIVTKGAMLKSGAFKQNAISSADRMIQGILYSRGGFTDAINNYEIGALECLSLDPSQVVQGKWPFKVTKWDEKEMVKHIIQKASASFHIADMQAKEYDQRDLAKKGIYHALRILMFGKQLKANNKITDFTIANYLKEEFSLIKDEEFDTRNYIKVRDKLMEELRT